MADDRLHPRALDAVDPALLKEVFGSDSSDDEAMETSQDDSEFEDALDSDAGATLVVNQRVLADGTVQLEDTDDAADEDEEAARRPAVGGATQRRGHSMAIGFLLSPDTHKLCSEPRCTKKARLRGLCATHGGARSCATEGCSRNAQAGGKCKAHGGGARCKAQGCTIGAIGSGLCRSHGGGKRCDFLGCTKGAQRLGSCSTHGEARRCGIKDCTKVARAGGLCRRHRAASQAAEATASTT